MTSKKADNTGHPAEPPAMVSVVLPLFNEAQNIERLYGELTNVLKNLNRPYEIILVDDASSDATLSVIRRLFEADQHVVVLSHLGNQGQTAALSSGFRAAQGGIIIAMDGDGQHDPAYIPQFVAAIDRGNDMASSWKEEDSERSGAKRLLSRAAHAMIRSLVGIQMNYFGATMKAYRRDILENVDLSGELHRFAGALVYHKGIRVAEIPIVIRPRQGGVSSYKLSKIFRVLLDLILIKYLTSYARAPFRFFGSIGMLFNLLGVIGIIDVLYEKYALGISAFQNTAIVELSGILIIVGIQFIIFGLIAELISRLYYTSRGRELSRVRLTLRHEK